jgi:hypothetical protein
MPGDCKVASPLFCSSLELLLAEGHLRWQILFNGAFQVGHQCRLLPNATAVALIPHQFTDLTCHPIQQPRRPTSVA